MSLPSIASLLDKRTIDHIADYAKDWAQVNGICVRLNDQAERSDLARIQAFTIAPSYVPYNLYHQAYGLQKDFGLLYHKIPFDRHFMKNTLSRVLETDTFTKRLYEIYDEVFDTMHRTQPHVLTIQRADYMFHLMDDRQNGHTKEVSGDCNDCSPFSSKYVLKQVEVNTMASGAAGIACKVAQLHDKVLKRYCSNAMTSTAFKIKGRLAENRAIENVAKAIVEAWKCYNKKEAAIIFVVEGVDLNVMDQRLTEYTITDLEDNIKIYRLTLKQCYYQLKLDSNMKLKFRDHETEVAVVYFRSGYSPHQYPTEHEWEARRTIEKSAAIKCPWIGAQLAGSKKIQQVLTNYRELVNFQSDRTCSNMMDTFAKIYSLDSDNADRECLLNKVRKNPHGYVLKPQREGGGNNLFGQAAFNFLESVSETDLESYILMERLKPMVHENILVRANQPLHLDEMDSEFGTFGYVLGSRDSVLDQAQYGHLFRTKPAADNEGGTIKGTAGHDAPFLIF